MDRAVNVVFSVMVDEAPIMLQRAAVIDHIERVLALTPDEVARSATREIDPAEWGTSPEARDGIQAFRAMKAGPR